MALTTDFNQVTLSGLNINNPTSLQFGPDGRLYVSQQNGTIKIANLQAITDGQGEITGYEVVGQVETINLVQAIPNHNDNGDLNTSVNTRQVTGLVVDRDVQGNIVLYVSSSDPRIGGGGKGEKNLDTNSGIISRLTLTNPSAPLGDSRWNKVDLVIGLPRSEENHSTNGLDIRTELVDGEEHQIMYVASGGNTNKGAPSNNFAWTSEYYYSTAILRVDLTQLEQIEATEGLQGGTNYVDSYVYALPTLNDPTRTDNNQGQDTANGATIIADAEAADTFGGNDGRNQAKYDPNGPVQVYSTGYRNQYDVVITEAGNLYTFDNGPNNGWGDRPLTAEGDAVYTSEQIGTNNPNINVDTGNDTDKDNLHLVTEGFYGGHPNPVYASGADAGLYTVDASSGSPVVTQLTEISDPANDPTTTADDLPSDWNTITGGITHPEANVYLGPGNNPDGTNKGADGSLLTIGSSSNGLTEYTADGLSDNPNAEILAVAPFNGNITFIEIESDGTQGGTNVTDTQAVNVGGLPLDLTAVGNNGIDGSGKFAGTVWVAQFGGNGIAILTPGTPPAPDVDQDDDGLDDNVDPLQYDSANGVNTVLNAGSTLFWDFNPSDSGQYPGKGTSAEGPFNNGLTGWMIDGVNYLDGLRNLDNTIRGGAPGIIQVKSVGSGNLLGSNNTQQDAIQTGFLPASDVKEFRIKIPIFNPFSSDANNGINWSDSASMGFTLGDGSMSNFLQIAVGAKNSSGSTVEPIVRVTYEENDLTISELEINANELLNSVDDDIVELFLDVDLATYQVSPSWRFQTAGNWSAIEQIGDNPVQLNANGQIVKALQGEHYIDGVQSAPVVTLTSTSNGSEPFTADFLDLTIESTSAFPGVLIQETDGTTRINEGGEGDSYSLVLSTQPTSDVTVTISPDAQINLDQTEVVFNTTNWNTPQIVNITAVDDIVYKGTQTVTIGHSVTSSDLDYQDISIQDLSLIAIDNDGSDVLYRINVGGSQVAVTDGSIDWSEDTKTNPSIYRVGSGGAGIYANNTAIDLSDENLPASASEAIFQTERWDPLSGSNMKWEFDVESGDYEVRLFLSEIYNPINQEGKRVFDVAVEGSVPGVFDDIDPVANAGQYSGFMLSHTTTVSDGSLSLEFLHEIQNPALKGIEILSLNSNSVLPSVSLDDVTVNEDAGTANFMVNLSAASTSEVKVDFATADDTAVANSDYISTNGTLTFAAGETSQTISVDITDDELDENSETFKVNLSNAVGANIVDGTGISTIVDNDNVNNNYDIAPFANIDPVDTAIAGQIGAAQITITPGSSIQTSNFGTSSFTIKNTGDKRIAAIYFDVTDALFPDTVFDPVGLAGDSVSRGLTFGSTGNTGVFQPGTQQPERLIPFYGQGGAEGYEGMLLTFNPNQDGGYQTDEIIKFGVDMDPNSIAGLPQKPKDINGNDPRLNSWDIGGVSGAELINSEVHVLFTDGTTAVGELGGDGSQGGAVAVASQSSPDKQVTLTVNGINAGGSGSYTQNDILVEVSGQAGDVARVVLTKGFIQPFEYVDPNGNAIDLATKFTGEAFPANNAIQFQTVDVTLDGTVQDITSLFDFGSPGGNLSFAGDDLLPIGLVASVIDANGLPVSSVTEPIYLTHSNDNAPTIPALSIDDVTVNEDAGTANFTVNLSAASNSEVRVDFATADDTAVANSDYISTNGTLTFAAGQTSQTITIDLTDDGVDENSETFSVNLSNALGANITDENAIGTIIDNDSINDPSILYRINVGGAKVAAADGSIDWSEDTNTNPSIYRVGNGGSRIYANNTTIDLSDSSLPASVSEAIFQTERWDPLTGSNMKWEFDVEQGDYEVRLFLSEIYNPINQAEKRVFDVAVEGSVPGVFDDIDHIASTGQYSGFMLSHTTTVADGSLSLEFLHEIENPALKGIEILSVDSSVSFL